MGGGPEHKDVVKATCLLTFPEETNVEPVPVDAWYLHAVGLPFLRQLARDRVDDLPIGLVMQRKQESHDTDVPASRRYIAVSSNDILRKTLEETFGKQDVVVMLHIISLRNVRGQRKIHVRPEIHPNVSPEPVAALQPVFPTLSFGSVQMTPTVDPLKASSYSMRQSMYEFSKDTKDSKEIDLSTSTPILRQAEVSYMPASTSDSESTGKELSEEEDIPMATVVESPPAETERINGEYVMLELQHGAGLSESSAPSSTPTYFISSNWHQQADEMSASFSAHEHATSSRSTGPAAIDESFIVLE